MRARRVAADRASTTSSSSPTGTAGGAAQVRALVVAGVGDDQPLGRGQQRVEQHLAILGARVAVADVRLGEHQVVAVAPGAWRGNSPSSSPSRQTTRCGTERIGTSVQTVRWPVRKFARVGRPAQPVGEQRAHVGQLELGVPAPSSPRTRRRRRRAGAGARARCQASRSLVAVSASAALGDGRRPARDRLGRARARRPPPCSAVDELGEAAGEVDRAALDVVERQHAARTAAGPPRSSPRRRSIRSRPARQVWRSSVAELERRAVRGVEPPADPARRRPSPASATGRRRRSRSAGGRARERRGRAPATRSARWSASVEQLADDAEHRVGLAQRAVGEPDAQVGRARPSGRRPARRRRGARPAPNVAWISGANVSMSGHITITSRGSSVGSSASRCSTASRSTSTCRARPWQAWIWTLRSSASSSGRASGSPGSGGPGGWRSSRMSSWMRASSVSARRGHA